MRVFVSADGFAKQWHPMAIAPSDSMADVLERAAAACGVSPLGRVLESQLTTKPIVTLTERLRDGDRLVLIPLDKYDRADAGVPLKKQKERQPREACSESDRQIVTMLARISDGAIRTYEPIAKIPRSIVSKGRTSCYDSAHGRLIFAATPELWETLGVAEPYRRAASIALATLVAKTDGRRFDRLYPKGEPSNKLTWYAVDDVDVFRHVAFELVCELTRSPEIEAAVA